MWCCSGQGGPKVFKGAQKKPKKVVKIVTQDNRVLQKVRFLFSKRKVVKILTPEKGVLQKMSLVSKKKVVKILQILRLRPLPPRGPILP